MKHCNSCDTDKEEEDFCKRAASKDGLTPKCKACQKAYDKARSKDPHRAEARAIYAQTPEGKLKTNKAKVAYRSRNPIKASAHAVVNRAMRAGNLFKEPCEICGADENIHAHHDDYLKPLNVRWFCGMHHKFWHENNGQGLNAA